MSPEWTRGRWLAALDDFPQLLAAGPRGPRKDIEIVALQNGSAGSGEVEMSHGASEAEQSFDPERARLTEQLSVDAFSRGDSSRP